LKKLKIKTNKNPFFRAKVLEAVSVIFFGQKFSRSGKSSRGRAKVLEAVSVIFSGKSSRGRAKVIEAVSGIILGQKFSWRSAAFFCEKYLKVWQKKS
jgi:hypothetical protein